MEREKLEKAIENFRNKNILVMGDIILDKFSWGKIEKLNPEQHAAPNVNIREETYTLGGAANVANNIVSMGGNCRLYGILGEGNYGEKIKKLCEETKIELVQFYNGNKTIVKQRIMAHGQQVARLNYGEENRCKMNPETKKELVKKLEGEISRIDFIILSDYNKGFFNYDLSQEIINLANSRGIPTLVDPKPDNINFFNNCTIIRPNKHEASIITGIPYSRGEETLTKMGKELLKRVNSEYAIITCGGDGVLVYNNDQVALMKKTKARKIADVTGAGDTFAAALALSLCSGLNVEESVTIANYAAGNVVEKLGVEITNIEEIKNRLKEDEINL